MAFEPKPSLDGSLARLARAAEHIAELEKWPERMQLKTSDWAISIPAGASGKFSDTSHGTREAPPIVSVLIGESVYNLRAALDYLVYELAFLDSGREQLGTQFLIESSEQGWAARESKCLTGVSPKHKASIRSVQPFSGVQWAANLREISNPDKHKRLVVANGTIIVTVPRNTSKATLTISSNAPSDVATVAAELVFEGFASVTETLREIEAGAENFISTFTTEFA